MKITITLLTLTVLFFVSDVKGQTNWTTISHPGVNFIIASETAGYSYINESVGSHGMKYTLKKSTDGLQTFTTIKTKTGDFGCYSLDEMFYINADTGFIAELCQGLTSIYRTMDGGENWTAMEFGGTYGLSMYFLDENLGYYSFFPGGDNYSYLMQSGTQVFTTKKYIFVRGSYQYPNHNTKIRFINDSTGFIICKDTLENTVILKTSNYGYDWSEKMVLDNTVFRDIYFTSDSVGFVIGDNGLILNTADYGETWQTINSNTGNNLYAIDFSNESVGYIAGENGTILKSSDNGASWTEADFTNTNTLIYVKVFENGHIYVNDDNGYLYSNYDPSGFTENDRKDIYIFPNPSKDKISIKGESVQNIELLNSLGHCIASTKPNSQPTTFNIEHLKPGIYFLKIEIDGYVTYKKFIKE
jgi:photosystem II stability/assembly factor-like uncharacterized protein